MGFPLDIRNKRYADAMASIRMVARRNFKLLRFFHQKHGTYIRTRILRIAVLFLYMIHLYQGKSEINMAGRRTL